MRDLKLKIEAERGTKYDADTYTTMMFNKVASYTQKDFQSDLRAERRAWENEWEAAKKAKREAYRNKVKAFKASKRAGGPNKGESPPKNQNTEGAPDKLALNKSLKAAFCTQLQVSEEDVDAIMEEAVADSLKE